MLPAFAPPPFVRVTQHTPSSRARCSISSQLAAFATRPSLHTTIVTLLNFWWRPGPDGELKTKHMQSSQNLREEEWYRDPPAMPVRDHKTPAQVVNSRDADCNRQHHHNRLITLDILREHKRGTNKQDRQDEQGTRVRVTNPANRQDHPHHRHYRKKLVGEFFLHQLKFSYWL